MIDAVMVRHPMAKLVRSWVAALYALSMLLLGFAHVPVVGAAQPAPPDLSAYVLPDGSLPSICGSNQEKDHVNGVMCDACLLTVSPGLLSAGLTACRSAFSKTVPFTRPLHAALTLRHAAFVAHLRGPPRA